MVSTDRPSDDSTSVPDGSALKPTNERIIGGHYRLIREIGRGGQGAVFLAEDLRLHRRVAVKILSWQSSLSKGARARFIREAEIASRLDHPGICGVIEAGEHEGEPFIVMPFVEGTALSKLIVDASPVSNSVFFDMDASTSSRANAENVTKSSVESPPSSRSKQSISRFVRIIESVARAIHVAHECGLVHRDMKPANVIVRDGDQPVILDFGLASIEDDASAQLTRSGELMGTPAYMSPEQLTRQGIRLDRRTDVWSIGVMLYECISGNRPFVGATREQLYQSIIGDEQASLVRSSPWVSKDLDVVVRTALEKNRDLRYATALDFAQDLARVIAREPIHARPAGVVTRALRWVERNAVVAALAGSLIVALVVFLAVTIERNKHLEAARAAAAANASTVREESARKSRALEEVDRLSDISRYGRLVARAERLWPMHPASAQEMERWIADAERLVERRDVHRRMLDELRRRGRRVDPVQFGTREEKIVAAMNGSTGAHYEFADPEDQWKNDTISRLLELSDQLADPRSGLLSDVRRRLEFARSVKRRSLTDFAKEWQSAIEAISTSPQYGGLHLAPQLGLIPLGRDRASGLYEFLDLATHEGAVPMRDKDGRIAMEAETGVIFVLIPSQTFSMGAQSGSANLANYDVDARREEGPVHVVTLGAYFISKYEMTQGQWSRLHGANPSHYHPGYRRDGVASPTLIHPVENISWLDSVEMMRRLGMSIPTEAQWACAARAGSKGKWFTGDSVESLAGAANVADLAARRAGARWNDVKDWAPFDDGYAATAPVGSYRANAFGIHDVVGNVSEWCFEAIGDYGTRTDPVDGERLGAEGVGKTIRGGSFNQVVAYGRTEARAFQNMDIKDLSVGIRPARALRSD